MRKFVIMSFVVFSASVFALVGGAQRRARTAHGHGSAEPPQSAAIASELGGIQWGWSHDQVVDYFRRTVAARYQPLLRNKGQVEQDRLMQERDRQVQDLRDSYVQFNGAPNQRRWDTSFVGSEYTHNNGESMLVSEDSASGNREFFLFFNDRLWKRFQARGVPPGSGLQYPAFIQRIEGLFGPGLHVNDPEHPDTLLSDVWQDATTRLHTIDNSTFFNAFCLVYEEKATLAHLTELRHNAPAKVASSGGGHQDVGQPQVGNVEADPNSDIVDRITGKIRRTQTASDAGASSTSGSSTTGTGTPPPAQTNNPPASTGHTDDNDPLHGL